MMPIFMSIALLSPKYLITIHWYALLFVGVTYSSTYIALLQIYRMSDMINTSNPPQYLTREEFLYEKHFVQVKPFSCLCWRITTMAKAPASLRVLYEHRYTK